MKTFRAILTLCIIPCVASTGFALSDRALYGDPPDETHPYAVHDMRRPAPRSVTPGENPGNPPSDAVVLFDGSGVSKWMSDNEEGGPCPWKVSDGALEVVSKSGSIRTRQEFGDCQLHIEWRIPDAVEGKDQRRGNSGIFLMGIYEVQVLDTYDRPTYPDGQAGSIYGQHPPLVNASRPAGQWQSYDIVFRRPIFDGDKVVHPASMTVFQNGVLVQDHWVLEGGTPHIKRASYEPHADKGPLKLQDHKDPGPQVRYRNIWIRELAPRGDGGLEPPFLSKEAVAAKRREIAGHVRDEAKESLQGGDLHTGILTLLESLAYMKSEAVMLQVRKLAEEYMAGLEKLSHAEIEAKKNDIRKMASGYKYLNKHGIVPDDYPPLVAINAFVKKHGLDDEAKKK